jgi:uncharacterized protein (TIGR03067 family)
MKTLLFLLLAPLGFAWACPRAEEEQKKLQGYWKVLRAVKDGEEVPKEDLEELSLFFEGNVIQVKEGDKINDRFQFMLHPDMKPRGIDFRFLEGKKKGRTDRGIYSLDGATLKICIQENPKGDRPAEFVSQKGSEISLVVLKKIGK